MREGLAQVYILGRLDLEEELLNAQTKANKANKGIWEKSTAECAECIQLNGLNQYEEFFILQNNCAHLCDLTGWVATDQANHNIELGIINASSQRKYESEENIWNNYGDTLTVLDSEEKIVLTYTYN